MAYWLPAIGGTLGAIEGYRRGGIGGAITGGLVGAVVPKGLRMAGTALGANLLPRLGIQGLTAAKRAGDAAATIGVGFVPGAVGGAVGGAIGGKGVANQYPGSSTGPVSGVYDYLSPISSRNLQLGWTQKELDQQRQAVVDQAIALRPIMEAAKEEELRRNMAAANYRTALGTEQGLTLQSQLGAQQLGRVGAEKVLGALAANYQYQ